MVGAAFNNSFDEIVNVTILPIIAREVVLLLEAIEAVTVAAVLSIVTEDPSLVALMADAPGFPFAS
jgi:hypothetical protein